MKARSRAHFNLRHRLLAVAGALGLFVVALVVRAVDLQLVDNEFYQRQGDARFLRELPIPTSRGMITDRNGEPLAVSTPVESVWGNPQELLKNPARLPELARALDVPVEHLTRKLSQRADKEFMYLARRVSPIAARKILARNIAGVYSQREFRRFYPQGEAMAHVLGFTNVDDRGQEGLELAFDEWLHGKVGSKRVIRDSKGRIVENVDLLRAAVPGKDLTLTLDRRIQYLTHRELKQALLQHGASSGSAVVLDVASGEVLAMANLPSYNPNAVGARSDAHRNRAVTDVIEPGSTMKPFTIAAALKSGVVTPDAIIDTTSGRMPLDRYVITDTKDHGKLNVTGILTKSSNIGAAKLSLKMPSAYFHDTIDGFGFGRSTGSGFPGESAGVFPPTAQMSMVSKATIAYGYGLSATPLQIAQAYAALGNGGQLIAPTFVKGERHAPVQVMDRAIADQVVRMLETVTQPGGTATQAALLGYRVAGKTGTSRKAGNGGYARRYVSVFAGLVPASKPRFAMVVVIDDPDPVIAYYGGLVSAPVFHNVMEGALRLMDVAPDDLESWLAAQSATQPPAIAALVADAPPQILINTTQGGAR